MQEFWNLAQTQSLSKYDERQFFLPSFPSRNWYFCRAPMLPSIRPQQLQHNYTQTLTGKRLISSSCSCKVVWHSIPKSINRSGNLVGSVSSLGCLDARETKYNKWLGYDGENYASGWSRLEMWRQKAKQRNKQKRQNSVFFSIKYFEMLICSKSLSGPFLHTATSS